MSDETIFANHYDAKLERSKVTANIFKEKFISDTKTMLKIIIFLPLKGQFSEIQTLEENNVKLY